MRRRPHPLAGGIMYRHWRHVPPGVWRWKNFTPEELACRRTGELYLHEPTIDALQRYRDNMRAIVEVNSAHRSRRHNIAIGGAPKSAHLFIAIDVSTRGRDRLQCFKTLQAAGFQSFGYYLGFIHTDLRPGRRWFGSQNAKKIWEPLLKKPDLEL